MKYETQGIQIPNITHTFSDFIIHWQNYTLLEQKGGISSIIDEIIKLRKT